MRKLLIAQHSEATINTLEHSLQTEWEIHICTDSYPIADILQYVKPEAMIIDLNLRPKNGLAVLEECQPIKPPITLATTNLLTPAIMQAAENLGVSHLVCIPFCTDYIKQHLNKIYDTLAEQPHDVAWHLRLLGLNPKLSGYRCLLSIIPIYKMNPSLLLKEIYPSVAKSCGISSTTNIERVIRTVIYNAWKERRIADWALYFPLNPSCDIDRPSNKEFIKSISEKL